MKLIDAQHSLLRTYRPGKISRREFLAAMTYFGIFLSARAFPQTPFAQKSKQIPRTTRIVPPALDIELKVNGQVHLLKNIDPRATLLDTIRERLRLTGTKNGCDHGQCGSCTVLVDDRRIYSCLALAAQYQNKEILTIEGIGSENKLHPMQAAFLHHDALQCGFCTPGQILSAIALLSEPCGDSDAELRNSMCGNLCRCGAYPNIIAAVKEVRGSRSATI